MLAIANVPPNRAWSECNLIVHELSDDKAVTMPRVRFELTTSGLWDPRAAGCAIEAELLQSTAISFLKIQLAKDWRFFFL